MAESKLRDAFKIKLKGVPEINKRDRLRNESKDVPENLKTEDVISDEIRRGMRNKTKGAIRWIN